jgi:predicted molibdopterin-dependent oxidoreductase YjgC
LENRIRKAFRAGKKVISLGAYPTRTSTFVTTELQYQTGEEENLLLLLGNEEIRSILTESRKLAVVAGDELFRQSNALHIIQELFSLHADLSKGSRCRILFPGFEGNLYSNALMGVHPAYLPGFQPIKQKDAGMTCNEMILNTGDNGISAMMVVGDLPAHPGLGRLNFLVQCNMFKTEMSEFADVLLPVPDFLESEGHVLSLDGRLKKVNRAAVPPGKVLSIAGIVTGLAKAMGEDGFSQNPVEIYREIRPLFESGKKAVSPLKIESNPRKEPLKSTEKGNGIPVNLRFRYNHFRYRGNALSKLIPDLESMNGKGGLGLSDSLMVKLKVKAGDRVRIVSEHGEMDSVVCSLSGQNCQTACLLPEHRDPSGILGGVYPESLAVNVMIKKI